MSISNIEMGKKILKLLQSQQRINALEKYGEVNYQLKKKDFGAFKPKSKLKQITKLLNKRIHETLNPTVQQRPADMGTQNCWLVGQYKSYLWISVCCSYIGQSQRQSLIQANQDFFNWLFCYKTADFIEYSARSLIKEEKIDRQKWPNKEIRLLYSILKRPDYHMKWSKVSVALFIQSNKLYFRSAQRCRELWFNQLNPLVSHRKWTTLEDENLLILVYQYGKKWSQISKAFNGTRNQHMVKNRFNSLLNRYKDFISQGCSIDKCLSILMKKIRKDQEYQFQIPSISEKKSSVICQRQSQSMDMNAQQSPLINSDKQQQKILIEVQPFNLELNNQYDFTIEQSFSLFNSGQYSQQMPSMPYFTKRLVIFDEQYANINNSYRL